MEKVVQRVEVTVKTNSHPPIPQRKIESQWSLSKFYWHWNRTWVEHKPRQKQFLKNPKIHKINLNIKSNLSPQPPWGWVTALKAARLPHNSRFEFSQNRAYHQVSVNIIHSNAHKTPQDQVGGGRDWGRTQLGVLHGGKGQKAPWGTESWGEGKQEQ